MALAVQKIVARRKAVHLEIRRRRDNTYTVSVVTRSRREADVVFKKLYAMGYRPIRTIDRYGFIRITIKALTGKQVALLSVRVESILRNAEKRSHVLVAH